MRGNVSNINQSDGVLKFCSLNVCGLKQRLKFPEFTEFLNEYDFICVSETHTDDTDDVDIDGYTFYSKHRAQNYRRKSGGIGIYVRNYFSKYVSVLNSESDYGLWLEIDKALSQTDEHVTLGNIYLPPESSRFYNVDEMNLLQQEIANMCAINTCTWLCGDINARIANLPDFLPSDPHLNELLDFDLELQSQLNKQRHLERLSIPLNRTTKDTRTNAHGLRLIEICRNNNLFILNGRVGTDTEVGALTFRDTSIIDYVIATAECFE